MYRGGPGSGGCSRAPGIASSPYSSLTPTVPEGTSKADAHSPTLPGHWVTRHIPNTLPPPWCPVRKAAYSNNGIFGKRSIPRKLISFPHYFAPTRQWYHSFGWGIFGWWSPLPLPLVCPHQVPQLLPQCSQPDASSSVPVTFPTSHEMWNHVTGMPSFSHDATFHAQPPTRDTRGQLKDRGSTSNTYQNFEELRGWHAVEDSYTEDWSQRVATCPRPTSTLIWGKLRHVDPLCTNLLPHVSQRLVKRQNGASFLMLAQELNHSCYFFVGAHCVLCVQGQNTTCIIIIFWSVKWQFDMTIAIWHVEWQFDILGGNLTFQLAIWHVEGKFDMSSGNLICQLAIWYVGCHFGMSGGNLTC